jgi:hypothetical protein
MDCAMKGTPCRRSAAEVLVRSDVRVGQTREREPRRTNSHSTATITRNHKIGWTVRPSTAAMITMTAAMRMSVNMLA